MKFAFITSSKDFVASSTNKPEGTSIAKVNALLALICFTKLATQGTNGLFKPIPKIASTIKSYELVLENRLQILKALAIY